MTGLKDRCLYDIQQIVCAWENSRNPIFDCIKRGGTSMLEQFDHRRTYGAYHKGGNVSIIDALMAAVWYGHVHIVQLIVERGTDVNAHTDHGLTALHFAVHRGNALMVEYLLLCGASADESNNSGDTPLHCVVDFIPKPALPEIQDFDVVDHFVSMFRQVQIFIGEPDHTTAQIDAECLERMAMACVLVLFEADIFAENDVQHTPETLALVRNDTHMAILLSQLRSWLSGESGLHGPEVDMNGFIRGALHYIDQCARAINEQESLLARDYPGSHMRPYIENMDWSCVVSHNTLPTRFLMGNSLFLEHQEIAVKAPLLGRMFPCQCFVL